MALLDIDILARLTRPNGRQRVPVLGRRHDNPVHVLVFEDPSSALDIVSMSPPSYPSAWLHPAGSLKLHDERGAEVSRQPSAARHRRAPRGHDATAVSYPQVAVYKGVGSTKDAGNFACKTQ
jgi:hypothetical protein